MRRDLVPVRVGSAGCRVCMTVAALLGMLVVAGVVITLPDAAKYIKLKMM